MKKILLTIALVVGFILPSHASHAEIKWRRGDFFQNQGGLNNAFSPISIAVNEAADLQNVVLTTGGAIKTRGGFDNVNSSATVTGTGLTFYRTIAGSKFIVGVFEDDTIKKMDYQAGGGPDGTWDDITGSLTFSVDQNDLSFFSIGEDTLLIEDGLNTTAPYKYTGTGNATDLGGSPPNATIIVFHKLHAFAAGSNTAPSTLSFSDLGDIENWTTGLSGNVSVETNDGTVITALVPGFDSLYIWKGAEGFSGGSIWRLSGDDKDNFVLQRMVKDIGTTSPHSIVLVGNDFIFMDSKGDFYIYDGGIKVRLISAKIEGTTGGANFSRFNKVNAIEFEKDFYIAISNVATSTNDILLQFDTFHLAWLKHKGINSNAMVAADSGSGKDALFFQDYSGFLQKFPSGTNDDGTAIDAFYLTKQYRFPDIPINKTFENLFVFVDQEGNYNLNVELRTDLQTSGTSQAISLAGSGATYGTAVFGTDVYAGQALVIGRLEFGQEGKFFQLKYFNSNKDEPFEIKGWTPYVNGDDGV